MLYPQPQFELIDKRLARFQEALTHTTIRRKLKKPIANLESKIARAFSRQGKSLVSRLDTLAHYFKEAKGLVADFDNIFEDATSDSSADMMGYIEKAVQTTFLNGSIDVIAGLKLGIAFDLKNPRAVSYLKDYGATQIKNIDDTTRDTIHTILTQAIDEGWSYNRMAGVISDRYKQFAVGQPQEHIASRAHLVAVTEIGNAYQAGNLAAVKASVDSGLTFEKQWLTVGDSRVSAGCLDNQAAGWIDLEDTFPSGDDRPLRFPGCRCVLEMRRKEGTVIAPEPVPEEPALPVISEKFSGFENVQSYRDINSSLENAFPDTTTFWNKQVTFNKTMRPVGQYEPSKGAITMNPNYFNNKSFPDESFKAIVHEQLHSRSKGIRDFNLEGLGWEEAIVERNAQLQAKAIAKSVGYSFKDEKLFDKLNAEHPYKKWIEPLNKVLKDVGLDEKEFYANALSKTCDQRKDVIKAALVEKYGKVEGRTKFLELNKLLQ